MPGASTSFRAVRSVESAEPGLPNTPVRIEVAMPRALFDRLTGHDEAPRCRYDTVTGLAEFVAEPGVRHEGPAGEVDHLLCRVADALADRGREVSWQRTGALRLLSADGAFEPDASFYLDPAAERRVREVNGYVDVRAGLPAPDLVVEIDRSRGSRHKLAPYFRIGVKEAWTFDRAAGAAIWTPDAASADRCASWAQSRVLPGVTCPELDRLLAQRDPVARARHSRRLARRVADRLASLPPGRPP